MSLRLKFGILLGLLGLVVLLALGASWWSFSVLKSEVREPVRSMTSVLSALGEAKKSVEVQRSLIRRALPVPTGTENPSPLSEIELEAFKGGAGAAKAALHRADTQDWRIRSGTTSLGNLERRIDAASSAGAIYLRSVFEAEKDSRPITPAVSQAQIVAQAALDDLHNLIERIEGQVVTESQKTLANNDDVTGWLLAVLGWSVVVVLLSVVLGMILFRRWVLRPVQNIRIATAKLAKGDLAYRIPLAHTGATSDELINLSTEVNHMAHMVKTMQDERVEQERLAALGEMIRRLAHNLRNPLAGIRGLAELTRAELPALGPQAADIKENQDRIITSVDRFEKWLNELLSATKPLAVNPEPTAIVPWLKGLVDAHRPSAQTRGVELLLETAAAPVEASFDARHLEYALSAILSNALEATSSPQARGEVNSGGRVVVEVLNGSRPQQNGQSGQTWAIRISDQGHGIPPDLRDSIFRPYFTTKRDGNGIGLAIALQVVKAHGGQIQVESPFPSHLTGSDASQNPSASAKGTCFTINLPVHGPILANDAGRLVARNGQSGAPSGQDSRH